MHDAHDRRRSANLLGALALAASGAQARAMSAAVGRPLTDAIALVALEGFLGGGAIDELAGVLGLSHSATVRLVDRLAAEGLARRGRDAGDARRVTVRLTAAGRRAARAALAARERALSELLAGLDAGACADLDAAAERILAGLTDGRAAARRLCRCCDGTACGHPDRCPVTRAADAAAA